MANKIRKRHRLRIALGGLFRRNVPQGQQTDASEPLQGNPANPRNITTPVEASLDELANIVTEDDAPARVPQSAARHPATPVYRDEDRLEAKITPADAGSDIWSKAFREALEKMGDGIDGSILAGKNAERMFTELQQLGKQAEETSVAVKGIKILHSIKPSLENVKFVLEVASPLGAIHPVASTALGVVKSVTAIAVHIAAADADFAKQIAEMLDQMQYINACDTLGQKTDQKTIHRALVLVYQQLLEFYQAAYRIVNKKGFALVLRTMIASERLPQIVSEFLKQTEFLQKVIGAATAQIIKDVEDMVYEQQISICLKRENLSDQVRYHRDLRELTAYDACQYLETDPRVIRWYTDDKCQSLALVGDTGFGKTICMNFLVEFFTRRNQGQVVRPKLCYYYCRDDSTGSCTSILCALVLSLLLQLEGLQKPFVEWYKSVKRERGTPDPAADAEWLMDFLGGTVAALDRPLLLVVDGLDECPRESRNRLVGFLARLASNNRQLKYLLSSRPQEEILTLLGGTELLRLGPDLRRDAAIVSRLVEVHLPHLSEGVQSMIRARLSPLAQGSAIWIQMTITAINATGIRAEARMREFLKDLPLPSELSTLYRRILDRHTMDNEESRALARLALRFLAATRRNLSIIELTCAVTVGIITESATTVSDVEKYMDCQRVMGIIQPFVSQVDFQDLKKRQVRLVHQSVKEFVVADSQITLSSLKRQRPDIVGRRIDALERTNLDLCIRYLLLDDIAAQPLFSERQIAVIELPQDADLFSDTERRQSFTLDCTWDTWEEDMNRYDPTERGFGEFFVYAASFWIEHLAHVTQEPLPAVADLERLCHAGSLRLDNWTQQSCRPGCAVVARYEFDAELYDPLVIVSLHGSDAVLHHLLRNADFNTNSYLPDSPLAAADQILQWGKLSRLPILFANEEFKSQMHALDFFRLMMRQWIMVRTRHDDWDQAFDLVNEASGAMVAGCWGNELLCIAAKRGCMPILQRLMEASLRDAKLRDELWRAPCRGATGADLRDTHQSVGMAVLAGHAKVVQYLLQQDGVEAHLRHVNERGESVLHLAQKSSNPVVKDLIVDYFDRHPVRPASPGDDSSELAAIDSTGLVSITLAGVPGGESCVPVAAVAGAKSSNGAGFYGRTRKLLKGRGTW